MTNLTPEQQRVAERFPHGAIKTSSFNWIPVQDWMKPAHWVKQRSLSDLLQDADFCREYGREAS